MYGYGYGYPFRRGGGDSFRPTDLAGSQLYFAKNTATPSLWNDQSPNGHDLSQGTAIQQPTIGANSVDFDGVDDFMSRSVVNPFISHTRGIFFMSFEYVSGEVQNFEISNNTTPANQNRFAIIATAIGSIIIAVNSSTGVQNVFTADIGLAVGYNYISIESDGSQYILKINGVISTFTFSLGSDNGTWLNVLNTNQILMSVLISSAGTLYRKNRTNKLYYNNTALSSSDMAKLDTFFSNPFNYDSILPATEPRGIFGASLYDWWDFTDNSTLTLSGSRIDGVNSKASGRQLTSTGANRPQIVTGAVNGLQVANFDGVSEFMKVPSSTALYNFLHDQSNGGMVIVVMRITDADPNVRYDIISNNDFNTLNVGFGIRYDDRASVSINNGLRNLITRGVNNEIVAFNTINNILPTQQFNWLYSIVDASNVVLADRSIVSVNNGVENKNNTSNQSAVNSDATYDLVLGRQSNTSDFFLKGDIAEIIITTGQPTALQLTQTQTYLTNKYGTFPIT